VFPQLSIPSLILPYGQRAHFGLSNCNSPISHMSHDLGSLIIKHLSSFILYLTSHNKSNPVSHTVSRLISHTPSSISHTSLSPVPSLCYLTPIYYILHDIPRITSLVRRHIPYVQLLYSLGFYLQYDLTVQSSSTLLHVRLAEGSYFKQDYHVFCVFSNK
jgi:hypothetical protein